MTTNSAAYEAKRYRDRVKAGLCVRCGKVPPRAKRAMCAPCAEGMKKASTGPVPLTYAQRKYRDAKAKGICVRCYREPAAQGKTLCDGCRREVSESWKASGVLDAEDARDDTPRCRCGLRLPCNSCIPTAAEYATARVNGGDASISVRSRAA